ncbi:pyridoxal kinase [Cephus cinctus]|uniref:Pyridoxal kinase n=1 Tax=Cephus cinctus TaxID=211228 RepID=A0AAJ7FHC5_CEPCN|nr:pyridoxal kinase [Cephus cinctus]
MFNAKEEQKLHVLSIQSHVVYGYVGNKSATFPLQLLGFDVDAINSVQLSNHTGYKVFKGQVLNAQDLDDLVDGLSTNDLDNYSHLLTGYVGSASFLRRIAKLIHVLKQKNPDLIYVCDPVMGDNGKMYVPEELKEIYKSDIVPLADIVTPNQFELEVLTQKSASTFDELKEGIKELHKMGPKTVVISSTDIDGKLTAIASSLNEDSMLKIDIPKIPTSFTGSGDLFAALFLAHYHLQKNIKSAIEIAINTLHEVLLDTFKNAQAFQDDKVQHARKIELRLIQNKAVIEKPGTKLIAELF